MGLEAISKAREYVEAARLPPAIPKLEGAGSPVDQALSQAKDQAAVVGSDVISFVTGVTAEQRQDLINSVLLAQLVAKVEVPDTAKIYEWYRSYFSVLKNIGWVVQTDQFATYRWASSGFQAHEAVIALATTLLGPGTGALAVIKATLDALKSMDANSPWMTIFNRESQSGKTARFQVTLAEPDDKNGFLVTLMAFGLEAKSTLTQVLFFKFRASEDVLKHFEGKISINAEVLAGVREEIRKKLAEHVSNYVRKLPDLSVLRQPPPAPTREALESLSPLSKQLLESITDGAITDAAGYREEAIPELEAAPQLESTTLPTDWRSTISLPGYQFIVRWETGGKAYYENVIKARPVWPGYSSGITIGCGWDLGYHSKLEFQTQWGARLARADFDRLVPTISFRTVEPNRATKVTQAQSLIRSLSDIVVPWSVAIDQFDNVKYPALIKLLYRALDNLDRIHPHCRGALLSLTFNRGAAFSAEGVRFTEMRDIGAAMRAGGADDFVRIPALIRSMKRLWGASSSLSERREGEARLFEAGLAEMRLAARVVAHAAEATESVLESTPITETLESTEAVQTDDADVAEVEAILADEDLEAAGLTVASVRWNPKDDEQPDYRHLDTSFAGTAFELTPEDLDALITANDFAPLPGKMMFALRGASLGAPKREDVASVLITDQRPDHRDFRCIIGVYDRERRSLSAYQASTVPNAAYVFKCYSMAKAGASTANLTSTLR